MSSTSIQQASIAVKRTGKRCSPHTLPEIVACLVAGSTCFLFVNKDRSKMPSVIRSCGIHDARPLTRLDSVAPRPVLQQVRRGHSCARPRSVIIKCNFFIRVSAASKGPHPSPCDTHQGCRYMSSGETVYRHVPALAQSKCSDIPGGCRTEQGGAIGNVPRILCYTPSCRSFASLGAPSIYIYRMVILYSMPSVC